MTRKQFVLGIDGGGTKTAATLADLQGNVLAEEVGGPSNFLIIGVEAAAQNILEVAEACCERAGLSARQVVTLLAGLTGGGRASDRQRMQAELERASQARGAVFEQIMIESDARIALEGALKGQPGMILICGTGSIALGKTHDNRVLRVGGWGRTIGDEGSGYAIGRDGLNAITRSLDGRGKKTALGELVAKRWNLRTQDEIIAAVYRENFDLAALAPLVLEAAEQHDLESERILNKATFELTEHVRALTLALEAAMRDQPRRKLPLAFIGGVIERPSVFTNILRHKIKFSLPQVSIVQPQASPSFGAVLLALRAEPF
jgi:N-acetylglucosamine kinase-like BadF-type ATPase